MTRSKFLTPPERLTGDKLAAEIKQIADSWGIEVTYKTRGNRCLVRSGDTEFQCMRWDLCQRVNELGLERMLGQ